MIVLAILATTMINISQGREKELSRNLDEMSEEALTWVFILNCWQSKVFSNKQRTMPQEVELLMFSLT